MLAASSDFSTPIGYQTNLMVQGVGGYKFLDYTKFGMPLQLICATGYTAICYFAFA
jgi:di/tricarboxylate transporter